MKKANPGAMPGITIRSILAISLAMLLMALFINAISPMQSGTANADEHALGVPAVFLIAFLVLTSGGVYALTRVRLLTRSEMLCVLFSLLIACPIMGRPFWGFVIATTQAGYSNVDDAHEMLSDKLWAHGPNLTEGVLLRAESPGLEKVGTVTWRTVDIDGTATSIPVLTNTNRDDVSKVRVALPLMKDGKQSLFSKDPHLVRVLARAEGLGSHAHFYCTVHRDEDSEPAQEVFISRKMSEPTYQHPSGFGLMGRYGVDFSATSKHRIVIELGLKGEGEVAFHDLRVINVAAIRGLHEGREVIASGRYRALPPGMRSTRMVVKPEEMWSLEGLKYTLSGAIPVRAWITPILAWTSIVALLLLAIFATCAIMRRQWIDNERYPLPVAKIPQALLGEGESSGQALPAIWRNRVMWMGFGLGLFWCLMRGWHAYNPQVPNMNVEVALKPYLNGPGWGAMWNGVIFSVGAIFLGLAALMEINVLLSVVLGYLLFRAQYWIGKSTGLDLVGGFPAAREQHAAAFVVYGLLIVILTRKYIWRVLKMAILGRRDEQVHEPFSYRALFLMLIGCFIGAVLWAKWLGATPRGMVLCFAYLILVGVVTAKVRAECGMLFGMVVPTHAFYAIPLIGGMALFGPSGLLLTGLLILQFCFNGFFVVGAMQIELVQLGRSFAVKPRHILATCLLGVVGGVLIGGWVFLSSAYAVGGDNYDNQEPFGKRGLYASFYRAELARATRVEAASNQAEGTKPSGGGVNTTACFMGFAGLLTAVVAILRYFFAGFFFHPMGIILGYSQMASMAWGSALVACVVRVIALKLGGAAAVRNRVIPFFIGVFLSGVAAYLLLGIINMLLRHYQPGMTTHLPVF